MPATFVVSLPAGAALFINDSPSQSTSAERSFITPALEPDRDYFYTLRAEWARDGDTLTATRRVTVRAGHETQVTLDFSEARVTAQRD